MRNGMKFLDDSRWRPRAMVRCGIWMGTRRAATVIATVNATTATMTSTRITRRNGDSAPVDRNPKVCTIAGQKRSMIEKKIMSDAPLPTPRSVICSPSHMTNIAPVVRKSAIWMRNANPGFVTAPCSDSVKSAYPHACSTAIATVR